MRYFNAHLFIIVSTLVIANAAQAGKLSIVIDDFGYRPQNENKVLQMPLPISVAILPNAPYAREMAVKAHNQGREILIHLPMAPLSKQPLERDTLQPSMSSEEIQRIIRQAVNNVPYAKGMNNHMGSAMTSSLPGMQKVMQALEHYQLYFLDSVTIGNSQASKAAEGTGVKVIKRKVFLDDSQNEAAIRQQFNRAVELARRNGSAIAIGHPHPATIKVLQQMLPQLPSDIVLVRPSALLNEPVHNNSGSGAVSPGKSKPRDPAKNDRLKTIKQCNAKARYVPEKIYADRMFSVIGESLMQSPAVSFIQRYFTRSTPAVPVDEPKADAPKIDIPKVEKPKTDNP
ncbi:divergent polysaccharide deacetylase family protein [Yersinia aleksiciae]|uniref:Putative divergent polysaccharide deacetylase n=1 Tax=Yersinia aleksiciae TaxID=263819 RepID=A0A0T9UNZ2_YERAE|nr:divergent polysaccharide deacetylase family protein [Yersinia aleksiciae]AKP33773.1 sugar deacetylase [Yersinia aleksiciae]MDA5499584.1 divergent polysaccharide deacetylase family protein [Yersinia aleksiciae]NIL00562.1 divergent polysaccharide deacetylase family protein [Yersinia aleksiciae]WQC70889.1 divergent polysaccharide deacetylase family protein [Yersinia aleksiciae]CFQ46574.1 putative divergent polysaccharide deacetylase [Yersinia aleksiciae]